MWPLITYSYYSEQDSEIYSFFFKVYLVLVNMVYIIVNYQCIQDITIIVLVLAGKGTAVFLIDDTLRVETYII